MTTPARYPSVGDVELKLDMHSHKWGNFPHRVIKAAIDIERERVAKELGNKTLVDSGALRLGLNVLRRAGKDEVADAIEAASSRVDQDETRALVVQNSAVKVPDDVMAAARFLVDSANNRASATVYEFLQTLTNPTETPR